MGNCCVGAVRYQIYPPEPDTHISLGPVPVSLLRPLGNSLDGRPQHLTGWLFSVPPPQRHSHSSY